MSGMRPEREAVVVGYGFEYLVMALNCGRSIRETNPGLATTLVTNVPIDPASVADRFDRVLVRDEPADRNRLTKTSVLDVVEASKMIYLDADAEVVGDLDPLFTLLDRFDIVLRMHPVPVSKPFELAPGIPGQLFPNLTGGMFLLRNGEPGRRFLAQWQRRLVESGLDRDHPALARAVLDLPDLRLLTVNAVWLANEFEHAALFTAKHAAPRIRHYSRPERDPEVAHRLRVTLDALLPTLPAAVLADPDVERVREKYRRITHPLFTMKATRHAYLAVMGRIDGFRGRQPVDVLDRRAQAQGRAYTGGDGRLWED